MKNLNEKELAIDLALHTWAEDSYVILVDGSKRFIASFDPCDRRAHVPEALALAHLHRVFVNDCLNSDYRSTVSTMKDRMS